MWRSRPSAICERALLCVHTKSTRCLSVMSTASSSAATTACGDGELALGLSRALVVGAFGRLDDRAVHPVCDRVSRRNAHVRQPDGPKSRLELGERQRTGDAADVAAALRALISGQRVVGDDVGDADPAAGTQYARDLS